MACLCRAESGVDASKSPAAEPQVQVEKPADASKSGESEKGAEHEVSPKQPASTAADAVKPCSCRGETYKLKGPGSKDVNAKFRFWTVDDSASDGVRRYSAVTINVRFVVLLVIC